jgi:hypothetical protein
MEEKRTPAQWTEYLAMESNPVTIWEYMAGCLSRILGAQVETARAAQHTEGMLGAIDQFAEQIAASAGLPYAASGEVRAALDRSRDEQRRLTAERTDRDSRD